MERLPERTHPILLTARLHARVVESGPAGTPRERVAVPAVDARLSVGFRAPSEKVAGEVLGSPPPGLTARRTAALDLLVSGPAAELTAWPRREPAPSPGVLDCADAVASAVGNYLAPPGLTLRGLHRSLALDARTATMGVINLTPDSFSDGSMFLAPVAAIARARAIITEGAQLIDLGAESTRPGATEISVDAEWKRLEPVLTALHADSPVPLSVDTRHAEVARRALDAGADLLNDVSGLRDRAMVHLLARTGAPAIVMHMRGTPATMQVDTSYVDLRGEVYGALADALVGAAAEGVDPAQLLVDPGLGFGKSAEQSLELLAHLGEFRSLGRPIVVGASRKSFLGHALGGAPVTDRLEAGLAAAVIAARAGASIVRTHDVRPTVRALAFVDAVGSGRVGDPGLAPPAPR